MKPLPLILLLLLSCTQLSSQVNSGFGVGITAGYSTMHCAIFEGYIGAQLTNTLVSLGMQVHGKVDPANPVILELRTGYTIGPIEPYAGIGYHLAGSDGDMTYEKYKGVRPALGLIFHVPNSVVTVSGGLSGDIVAVKVGVYFIGGR